MWLCARLALRRLVLNVTLHASGSPDTATLTEDLVRSKSLHVASPSAAPPYRCMATVVGSLVMLSITEAKANTPDPDSTVILA